MPPDSPTSPPVIPHAQVEAPVEPPRDPGLERLTFFVDAVFAIALTLLALDLRLPESARERSGAELLAALTDTWPRLLSYATAFLSIAILWVGHHRYARWLRRANGGLVWLTLACLALVAFLPFPTSVLADHIADPVAAAFFFGTLFVTALGFSLIWWYATSRRLVAPDLPAGLIRHFRLRTAVGPVVFLVLLGLLGLGLPPIWTSLGGSLFGLALVAFGLLERGEGGVASREQRPDRV